jgi:hypothetical protein
MSAPYNPPKKGEDFSFQIALEDYANPGNFKVNPTIAAGDFKITKDGGATANLTTLPSVAPAGGIFVTVSVSATETTADVYSISWVDQTAPKEWADNMITIITTA